MTLVHGVGEKRPFNRGIWRFLCISEAKPAVFRPSEGRFRAPEIERKRTPPARKLARQRRYAQNQTGPEITNTVHDSH